MMNLTSLYNCTLLVFTLIFICGSGYFTAQEREPDLRIDTKATGKDGYITNIQFSGKGSFPPLTPFLTH